MPRAYPYGSGQPRGVCPYNNYTIHLESLYYLVVNFHKFNQKIQGSQLPQINLVRFGWLDREDWQGQAAATGQQAKLSPTFERYKLLQLPTLE